MQMYFYFVCSKKVIKIILMLVHTVQSMSLHLRLSRLYVLHMIRAYYNNNLKQLCTYGTYYY